ncbi:MAG: methyltransferase [Alistipes sp.]|nr:methyltransferase [Alistipes sp.]
MKVGTDGVLLGAWVELKGSERRILDVGTGTGVIALMLAQRAPQAMILGVDVAEVEEACANAEASPWSDRVRFVRQPVQQLEEEPFDLIVSNPPFFVEALQCPDAGRTTARHAVELPFEELRDAVVRLMSEQGRFAVVLPIVEAERFVALCDGKLQLIHATEVRTTPRHAAKRLLMEFCKAGQGSDACRRDSLMIGTGEHETYTDEYRRLTGDFYLKF